MSFKIIRNKTLKEYKKRYRHHKNLLQFTAKEVQELDVDAETKGENYLLNKNNWWLIDGIYYQAPKAFKPYWFRNLSIGIQTLTCLLGAGIISTAVIVPVMLNPSDKGEIVDRSIAIDTSIKDAKIIKSKYVDGNLEITLESTDEVKSIIGIDKICIGNSYALKDNEYSFDDSNCQLVIKKEVLDSHKGNISITPKIVSDVLAELGYVPLDIKDKEVGEGGDIDHYKVYCTNPEECTKAIIPAEYNDKKITGFFYDYNRRSFYETENLREVILKEPKNIKTIDKYAFSFSGIKRFELSDYVTTISDYAFCACKNIKELYIPASVKNISSFAFISNSLNKIEVDSDNAVFDSRNNCNAIIHKTNNSLIVGCKNTVIPTDITCIGSYSFCGNNLENVSIPSNIEIIDNDAFKECENLKNINLSSDSNLKTIGQFAFDSCSSLESITIPDSVETIGWSAFNDCSKLTNVTINPTSSLISLGQEAFSNTNISSIFIPKNVTSIGDIVVSNCPNLSSIKIDKQNQRFADYDCNCIIDKQSKFGVLLIGACKSTILPDKSKVQIEVFGREAFCNCGLTTFVVPSTVKTIQESCFAKNNDLSSFTFEANSQLKTICIFAFTDCFSLKNITIPASVTSIEGHVFYYYSDDPSTGITSVTFEDTSNWHVSDTSTSIDVSDPSENANQLKVFNGSIEEKWGIHGISKS